MGDNFRMGTGRDDFGKFFMEHTNAKSCTGCGSIACHILVLYDKGPSLPHSMDVSRTILKDPRNRLGIDCGCYARFHRQVAHIADKMAAKASAKDLPKEATVDA